jgi:hypothetical protein
MIFDFLGDQRKLLNLAQDLSSAAYFELGESILLIVAARSGGITSAVLGRKMF